MYTESSNLLCRWFEEVWNQGRAESINELAAPDVVAHGLTDPAGQEITGRELFKVFWREFRTAFPDIRIEIHEGVVEGDKVMILCTVHGTHAGESFGLVPTQAPVRFTGMCLAKVRAGQLIEVWNNFDFQTMMAQLAKR